MRGTGVSQAIRVVYRARACSVCEADKFEVLNRRTQEGITKKGIFLLEVVEGICTNCGFVYANPVPAETDLLDYYRSKFLYSAGPPTYEMDRRLTYLRKVCGAYKKLLEVGSNEGSFLKEAGRLGFEVSGLELNADADTSPLSIKQGEDSDGFEIVVACHVLEHVVNPPMFLRRLRSLMKPDGIMIVEVPNLHMYGRYSSALSFEHLSHFSPANLACLVRRAGFAVLEYEFRQVSRPLGFVLLARNSEATQVVSVPEEYEVNRGYYLAALSSLLEREGRYQRFMEEILQTSGGRQIGMWGANPVMLDLLKVAPAQALDRVVAVDANPQRWNTRLHDRYEIVIKNPDCLRGGSVGVVVICAIGWEQDIAQSLSRMGFHENHIVVAPLFERKRALE